MHLNWFQVEVGATADGAEMLKGGTSVAVGFPIYLSIPFLSIDFFCLPGKGQKMSPGSRDVKKTTELAKSGYFPAYLSAAPLDLGLSWALNHGLLVKDHDIGRGRHNHALDNFRILDRLLA